MTTNMTSEFVDQLQWSATKSNRSSLITLSIFNILAALATLACITWDCYKAAWKDSRHLTSSKRSLLRFDSIGPLQVYPLILSVAIIIQGIIFARVQTKGLEELLIEGCVPHSSVMFPSTFIVPYIQVIFAMETTIRSIPRVPFLSRAKWVVPGCLAFTVFCLILTLVATVANRPPNVCYATLFWFIQQWRIGAFVLFFVITIVLLLCGFAIFVRLRRSPMFLKASEERLAASQMVYYIAVAAFTNLLMLPFFGIISFGGAEPSPIDAAGSSTIASVVANLSGLVTGAMYLFLRTSRTAIIDTGYRIDPDVALPRHNEKGNSIKITASPAIDTKPSLTRSTSQERLSRESSEHSSRCTSPYSASLYDEYTGESKEESLGEKVRRSFETAKTGKSMPKSQFTGFSITKPPKSAREFRKSSRKSKMSIRTPEVPPSLFQEESEARDSVVSRPLTSSSMGRGLHSIFSQKNTSQKTLIGVRSPSIGLLPATTYSPTIDKSDAVEAVPSPVSAPVPVPVMPPPPAILPPKGHQSTLSASSATVQIGLKIMDIADAKILPSSSSSRNPERAFEISSSRSGITSVPTSQTHSSRMVNHSIGRRNSSVDLVRDKELPSIPDMSTYPGGRPDVEIAILDASTYNPKKIPRLRLLSPIGTVFNNEKGPKSPFQKAAQFMNERWSVVRESGSQWF